MVLKNVSYTELDERTGEIITASSEKQLRLRVLAKNTGASIRKEKESLRG